MKLKVLGIGKFSLKPLMSVVEDYKNRIGHYLPIEMITLKSVKDILTRCKKGDQLILLDAKGRQFDSLEFAKWLERRKLQSIKNLIFVIGPAEGFEEEMKKEAQLTLSLSKMTLQHELALVVFLEQLYRACTILKGESYHK